jgi:protein-S-isoprenylcysteine O-methyltransferase Ste14
MKLLLQAFAGLAFLVAVLVAASVWASLALPALAVPIIARLLGEEAELAARLPGYRAHQAQVRFRLVPGIW